MSLQVDDRVMLPGTNVMGKVIAIHQHGKIVVDWGTSDGKKFTSVVNPHEVELCKDPIVKYDDNVS